MTKKIIFSVFIVGSVLGLALIVSAATRDIVFTPQAADPYTCNASTTGAIYFKNDNKIYSCNGSAWAQVGGAAGGGSVSTSSALSAYYFPYWSNATGGLMGTSTIFYSSSTGNIGIGGVVTPQNKLDVTLGTNSFVTFGNTVNTNGSFSGIHFGYKEDGNANYRKGALVFETLGDSSARGKVHILNDGGADASSATLADARLTVDYNGNVGIGTVYPSSTLHVVGSAKFSGTVGVATPVLAGDAATRSYVDTVLGGGTLVIENPTGGDPRTVWYGDAGTITAGIRFSTGRAGTITKLRVLGGPVTYTMKLWDYNTQTVLASGTVTGINNTTWAEVAVNVSTTVSGQYVVTYTESGYGMYYGDASCPNNTLRGSITVIACGFVAAAGFPTTWNYSLSAADVTFSYSAVTASQWNTTSTSIYYNVGNVGIGTASPGSTLDVLGTGNFSGTVTVATPTVSSHAATMGYVNTAVSSTIPTGMIAFFASACPANWTEYTALRGRVIVGTPSGGTNAGTVGTALTNLATRTITDVPAHTHAVDPPATASGNQSADHTHTFTTGGVSVGHTHSVNPPSTSVSITDPGHTHTVPNSYGYGGSSASVNNAGGQYDLIKFYGSSVASATTGITASVDIAAVTSGAQSVDHTHSGTTAGMSVSHTHTTDIGSFTSGSAGSASVDVTMPYIQLTACQKS